MASSPHITRERGFALVSRLNRWIAAGAIILSGSLSVAAANAFHGRTRGQSTRSTSAAVGKHSASGGSSNTSSGSGSNSSGGGAAGGSSESGGGGLQPPAQAPTSAPAAPSGGVVSGGS